MQLNREQIINLVSCPTCDARPGCPCLGVVRQNGNQRERLSVHRSRYDRADWFERRRRSSASRRPASAPAVHSRTPQPDTAREAPPVAPRFDPHVPPARRRAQARLAALDIIGFAEIARRLGVAAETPCTWRVRGQMPEPDLMVGDCPAWLGVTIHEWAQRTNRLPDQQKATSSP